MKVAIVGSRNFTNYSFMERKVFDAINEKFNDNIITQIISGGAIGADTCAEQFAKNYGIPILVFKPEWAKYGKAAGMIRNKDIIQNADFVIAFWDYESRGTKSSIDIAKKLNIPTVIVDVRGV